MTRTVATCFLLLMCNSAQSQSDRTAGPPIHGGFLKAQSFLGMNTEEQRLSVMATIDGMYTAPMFGAPPTNPMLMRVEKCVEGKRGSEVSATVLRYIKAHPTEQEWDLGWAVYNALLDSCSAQK